MFEIDTEDEEISTYQYIPSLDYETEEETTERTTEGTTECLCAFAEDKDSSDSSPRRTHSQVLFDKLNHPNYLTEDIHFRRTLQGISQSEELKLLPFKLEWSFGVNTSVPIINLSDQWRSQVFFAASHKGVLYHTDTQQMEYIHGHPNTIVAASCEETGRWLVTSDIGPDSVILVTDTYTNTVVHTIDDSNDEGAIIVSISPNGKYLISVHNPECAKIQLWLWTVGLDESDATLQCDNRKIMGLPKSVCYHPNEQEYIMIIFERQVLFTKWNEAKSILEPPVMPVFKKQFGLLTDCVLLPNCHECFASTTKGHIVIFGGATYSEEFEEHGVDYHKSFVKAIKISTDPILFLEGVDGIMVCADSTGTIYFVNRSVQLLYWISNPAVSKTVNLSFSLMPRKYKFDDPFNVSNEFFTIGNINEYMETAEEDRVQAYEILYKNTVPSIASLNSDPFIIRSFFTISTDGAIYFIDLVKNVITPYLYNIDSPVASIDCNPERSCLVVAYESGSINMYDYKHLKLLLCSNTLTRLPNNKCDNPPLGTVIKYSPEALELAFSKSNGELWFLNLVLEPIYKEPYLFTNNKILRICFSFNSLSCAFYESSNAVYLLRKISGEWILKGKLRSHFKNIKDMFFTRTAPTKLFTIGEDRYIVEYNIDDSDDLTIKQRYRIEQSAIPQCFLYYTDTPDEVPYFIVANNQQKYKLIHEASHMCRSVALGPSYGCYGTLSLDNIMLLNESNGKYLMYSNGKHVGLQKLPPDGNPYAQSGVLASPNLNIFCMSPCGGFLFTCGHHDNSTFMWRITKRAVEDLQQLGGSELEPYHCLIEGGANGWYFKEMQDLFCYMQILHQGDSYEAQKFKQTLSISELPDLMRSCGFYPSDYEIQDILNDIKYRDFDSTGTLRELIIFKDFIKLYINHRPSHGVPIEDLREKFEDLYTKSYNWWGNSIDSGTFVDYLCQYGEAFSEDAAEVCLEILNRFKTTQFESPSTTACLPERIDFEHFADDILGILLESVYETTQKRDRETEDEGNEPGPETSFINEDM